MVGFKVVLVILGVDFYVAAYGADLSRKSQKESVRLTSKMLKSIAPWVLSRKARRLE